MISLRKSFVAISGVLLVVAAPASASVVSGTIETGAPSGDTAQEAAATPGTGTYSAAQSVSLSAGDGASIRFTTNGTTPTCSVGTVYSTSFSVAASETVKTIACYSSVPSNVSSFIYVINLPPSNSVASPVAGTYSSTQSVTLSSSGSTSIRYTTNGDTPSCSSGSVYSSAITVSSSETIKAVGCNSTTPSAAVSVFGYTITTPCGGGGGGGGGGGSSGPSVSGGSTAYQIYYHGQYYTLDQYNALFTTTGSSTSGTTGSTGGTTGGTTGSTGGQTSGNTQGGGQSSGTNGSQNMCAVFTFKSDLKSGSTGQDVKQLQIFLNGHGFIVANTGVGSKGKETTTFGAGVKAAIKAFQLANDLPVDGAFAGKTRVLVQSMMGKVVCPVALKFPRDLKTGSTGLDVKQLQIFLNGHGFIVAKIGAGSKGKETTLFGAGLRAAVSAFQKANKIVVNGVVSGKTRELLNKMK